VHFRIGISIWKCLVWSVNAELCACFIWKDESHATLELGGLLLSFTVLNMDFCEIKKKLNMKNQIYTRN
jgi:hypothetical protein